jgi:hypothetical protein
MASTRRPSQADQVASNARRRVAGGCTFADAPNAVTSAAAIVHQISMRGNIAPRRVIRLSRVSSRASTGFTTIVPNNSSPARSFPPLTRIRRINRRPDQPERCLRTGKRCFTNSGRAPRSVAGAASPTSCPRSFCSASSIRSARWCRRSISSVRPAAARTTYSVPAVLSRSLPTAVCSTSTGRGSGFVWSAFIQGTASQK